jgi:geranylgeranylglycerol-phosphate geranylgeranyltransferase
LKEKLSAFFTITRPVNFFITFISVLVAVVICFPQNFPEFNVWFAAFSAALTSAAGNIINDIFDIEIDKINRPNRPLPSGIITIRETYVLYFGFVVISLLISALISVPAFLIVLFSHSILFLYSKILKRIPLIGNVTVAFLTGLVFIFGGVVVGNPSAAIVLAIFAFLINLIREIIKDMQDVDGDKKSGVLTFPINFGFRNSKILVTLFTFCLIAFTFYPFITKLYNIEFFVIVMVIVNPILIFCVKKIYDDHSKKSLNKISNLLKLSMILGLIAVYLGV